MINSGMDNLQALGSTGKHHNMPPKSKALGLSSDSGSLYAYAEVADSKQKRANIAAILTGADNYRQVIGDRENYMESVSLSKLTTMCKITQQSDVCENNNEQESQAETSNVNTVENVTKSVENKCLPVQLSPFSSRRELKACTTSTRRQLAYSQESFDGTTIESSRTLYRCEPLEYVQGLQTGLQLQQTQPRDINLAARKAQLRKEFFAILAEQRTSKTSPDNLCKRYSQTKARYDFKKFKYTTITELACNSKVKELVKKFDIPSSTQTKKLHKMLVNTTTTTSGENCLFNLKPESLQLRHSPLSDEGCNLTQSPYASSDEDNESICTASTTIERPAKRKEKVARSASSDSALGLDVEESSETLPSGEMQAKRRMTLTVTDLPLRPALLPLAEPTALPDTPSPTELQQTLQGLLAQNAVPSKVLLEERVVELPVEDCTSLSNSRRESAQSCLSDYPLSECSGVRFMRTPSVVVSDYSDDVMCGITLEEIEYFRAQRVGRRCSSLDTTGTEKDAETHSDVSAASSCSNLYYCGSTISALDGAECIVNGARMQLERKTSDCSNCSNSLEAEEATTTLPAKEDLSDLLAAQHIDEKVSSVKKKVGIAPTLIVSSADN